MPATLKTSSRKKTSPAYELPSKPRGKVNVLSSEVAYQGPLFRVDSDYVQEPGGIEVRRDIIRHSGSVVILAVDEQETPRDPVIILERQYRHAAGRYLWEIPAGRKDPGEKPLAAAKRELIEETGYRARRWTKLNRYFASPGFLGEWMEIYLAQDIAAGKAQPEVDEYIHIERVPLSYLLKLIHAGQIYDGKTMIAVLLYAAGRRDGRFA